MTDPIASDAPTEGFWLSVSDLARERGVGKSSISRRVARLEEQGLLAPRLGLDGRKLVNIAAYDRATGQATDAIREANGGSRSSAPGARRGSGLAAEQARRTAYQADLARLDLEERERKVLRTEDVVSALQTVAERLCSGLERLPGRADDIAAAAEAGGAEGVRAMMKTIVHELRIALARDMAGVAEAAASTPETSTASPSIGEAE